MKANQQIRSSARRRALKDARIINRDLQLIINCTLRNLSERGALLDLNTPVWIPNEFDLCIKAENIVAPCQVVWREGQTVGIKFNWQAQLS